MMKRTAITSDITFMRCVHRTGAACCLSLAFFGNCPWNHQGGSTTMWIPDEPNGGVVSRTCEKAQCAPRSIANGLFVQALDMNNE